MEREERSKLGRRALIGGAVGARRRSSSGVSDGLSGSAPPTAGTPDKSAIRAEIAELQHRAEEAFILGDVAPRLAAWSHDDPVSVFAALGPSRTGWAELEPMFRSVAARLADGRDVTYEIVAFDATESVAWSAGFLSFSFSLDGGPVVRRTLRVTHVYRREQDGWRIAHEHSNWEP